jgi:lipopolysaccharide/colanic/teichoic acid biosynthesis glycosyltransferase
MVEKEWPSRSYLFDSVLDELSFKRMLALERKRADRSKRSFALVTLDVSLLKKDGKQLDPVISDMAFSVLSSSLRETDVIGWHTRDSVFGVLLTEFGSFSLEGIVDTIRRKIEEELHTVFDADISRKIYLDIHIYPAANEKMSKDSFNRIFYPEVLSSDLHYKASAFAKRGLDLTVSLALLPVLAPLMIVLGVLVKLTSRGPAFHTQLRQGQLNKEFILYKFRSMREGAGTAVHEEYVEQFIKGGSENLDDNGVFKITSDSRITAVGRFLRKLSLDELPQFINVLKGDISLVGPRPPLPYEIDKYDTWHKARVLEVKPGLTGLWQVDSRNQTTFDDMVRMDLRYARGWSLWKDIKLILRTPWAMFKGDGAC